MYREFMGHALPCVAIQPRWLALYIPIRMPGDKHIPEHSGWVIPEELRQGFEKWNKALVVAGAVVACCPRLPQRPHEARINHPPLCRARQEGPVVGPALEQPSHGEGSSLFPRGR